MMLQEILNQGQGHAVDAAKNFAFDQVMCYRVKRENLKMVLRIFT